MTSLRVATPELVDHRVRQLLAQRADIDAVAIRAEPRWPWGDRMVDGRRVHVTPCASPLAVRAALAGWAGRSSDERAAVLVVLADLANADLGEDVLSRFAGARVVGLEPWDAVRSLFGAVHLDSAFAPEDGWVAVALLAHADAVRQTARPQAVLTKDAALDAVASALLGLSSLTVDAVVARAASGPGRLDAVGALDTDVRTGLLDGLRVRDGAVGRVVASIVDRDSRSELVELGLAARAVYGGGDLVGGKAAGHLEARVGQASIPAGVGAAFATRCEVALEALLERDVDRVNELLARADALAASIGAEHAERSVWLPSAYDARLRTAAGLLAAALEAIEADDRVAIAGAIEALGRSLADVRAHHRRATDAGRQRFDHLEMAARLVAWLATSTPPPATSFEEAATGYAASSAWVDRARRRLWHGDSDPTVSGVYRRVLDTVVARRLDENRAFAERLSSWTSDPSSPGVSDAAGIVRVEDVLAQVVRPLARSAPALFVVLDGCGLASFVELEPLLRANGFREAVPAVGRRLVGIAALPTVTEVSRASLLAGTLDRGNQEHERKAFSDSPTTRVDGRQGELFHQSTLLGPAGSSLAAAVEAALGSDGPPIVGAVINTIDDHLKKGTFADELRLADLHALAPLLELARTHGRTVVISADHGHVLAQPDDGGKGTFAGGGTGGERWRQADHPPGQLEVLLRGDRVLLGGEYGVLAPWDDDFRYGAKAGGYHGGATPEEVLVPVAVFVPAGLDAPAGWTVATVPPPPWWGLAVDPPAATPTADAAPTRRKPPKVDEAQTTMFEDAPTVANVAPVAGGPTWLEPLLASDGWKLQLGSLGRARLDVARVRAVLTALVRRGGVATFAAIAADAGVPADRLPGFVALLARALNVEGYPVLDVDASGQDLRLNEALLLQQFELGGAR